ncbi:hypothetical protein Acr_10g0009110 [Actinidia rufa]|uniref:Retrovirus-related Pol polyprotein from transposon TNT 1-94-like beta-barrel domain-containing protein n=1 Tax=Actinidia rufa TaxID=165716 RepID=A0A7J0FAT3_9ERIC|nr:hypothetical protein Acr_10g0009110 [Actinidia rufa]
MAEHNLGSMIVLSATNYAIWNPRMEDILFCKDLHNPLENKGEKPLAKTDKEWRKMNRKTIGLIRQCIGHEVFHHVAQETSTYELWIKLEEIYQAKTSQNKALLMRRLVNLKLQRETTVAEHTSEFQSLVNQLTSVDLQFDDEIQALLLLSSLPKELEDIGSFSQQFSAEWEVDYEEVRKEAEVKEEVITEVLEKDGGDHKREIALLDTAATSVMAVDESEVLLAASDNGKSDWVLDSGSAYHLCTDREVFSTYATCEGCIWMANNTSSRVVGRGSVRFRMADGRSVTLTEGKKTRGLYRLEGSVQIGGATVRHRSSGISEKNGQGKQPLHKGTQSKRKGTWRIRNGTRAQGDVLGYVRKSGQTQVVQPVQDVHRKAQRKETKSILRSCTAKGAVMPK